MAQAVTIQTPPRLTGNAASDNATILDYLWAFYNATIREGGVLQPSQLGDLLEADFPTLHALGILAGTDANKVAYFTAPNTWALTGLSAFIRTLLDDADAATARATLGVTTYTDEQAQDAVGGILTDTATIDFTYDDAGNQITADVKNDSITFATMQNIATDTLIGRSTAGTGDPESIACTTAGRALIDDANAAAQRVTLGLGAFAEQTADLTIIPRVPEFTVATVPSAATNKRGLITVSDEAGGYTLAFSDGVNWRRAQDRAVVS